MNTNDRERYIGIKSMVGAKVGGKNADTPVFIIDADGNETEINLKNDEEFAAFMSGRYIVSWVPAKSVDQSGAEWISQRKNARLPEDAITREVKDGGLEMLCLPVYEGLQSGDHVCMLASSRASIALKFAANMGEIMTYQMHTKHLHDARDKQDDTSRDAEIICRKLMNRSDGVYQVRESDAVAAILNQLFNERQDTQRDRIAVGNRVRNKARELHMAMSLAGAQGRELSFEEVLDMLDISPNQTLVKKRTRATHLRSQLEKATDLATRRRILDELLGLMLDIGKLEERDGYTLAMNDAQKYLKALEEGGVPDFEDVFEFTTRNNTAWRALMNEEKRIENEILQAMEASRVGRVLLGVKGIGPAIGGGIIGLIRDTRRFEVGMSEELREMSETRDELLKDAEYAEIKALMAEMNPDLVDKKKTTGFQRLVNARAFCLDPAGLDDAERAALIQHAIDLTVAIGKHDPPRAAKARLRSYAGCAPHGGEFFRSRRKKDGEEYKSCNRELRQRLYQLGSGWVKRYKNPPEGWVWAERLNQNIVSYREKHPEPVEVENKSGRKVTRYSDGHIIKMAMWKTLSEFLDWLYDTWSEMQREEGQQLLAAK